MPYTAPTRDMLFILRQVIGAESLGSLPGQDGLSDDLIEAVLREGANLAEGILAPLNHPGDQQGCVWKDGEVKTADGWKAAYDAYRTGGWNGVPFSTDFGGQGLPWCVAFPLQEMWQGANMAFGLCPLLNQGAVEAIVHHGSPEQQAYYLPKLISGEWTGTMNLTEPQAGSDLAAVRTRAERNGDGTYKVFGQKIFITYGEHDLAENIIHLVLARLPDAPEGVKGISLFIVPKFLEDGTRNDLICASIEHKLGIHASPTCTMAFGDKGGATAYLIGQEHEGIKYMFTMMNNARLSVGLQGVAVSDRA
ncbi:MAG TPA: acyl-CoA dehydrogenase family protein, partial [Alphaproteobacteria bacterium]